MSISEIIKKVLPNSVVQAVKQYRFERAQTGRNLRELRDLILIQQTEDLQRAHPNPLNAFGRKCFSQTDEDGITIEILRRLKCIENGTFAEFGVGNGMENNTLILKALGWRGFWVGGESLAFEIDQPGEIFTYFKSWITLDNIQDIADRGRENLGGSQVDVVSLDLDGNDIYFVEKLLSVGCRPKLFIVEYNAKFPPPVRWQIDYDSSHTWENDDYFGASLASFVDLFERNGFRLVCCNSHTGANAFFVREEFLHEFSDVPRDMGALYVRPRYFMYSNYGHKRSIRTVAKLFVSR